MFTPQNWPSFMVWSPIRPSAAWDTPTRADRAGERGLERGLRGLKASACFCTCHGPPKNPSKKVESMGIWNFYPFYPENLKSKTCKNGDLNHTTDDFMQTSGVRKLETYKHRDLNLENCNLTKNLANEMVLFCEFWES
jgi:hypothetical protein